MRGNKAVKIKAVSEQEDGRYTVQCQIIAPFGTSTGRFVLGRIYTVNSNVQFTRALKINPFSASQKCNNLALHGILVALADAV